MRNSIRVTALDRLRTSVFAQSQSGSSIYKWTKQGWKCSGEHLHGMHQALGYIHATGKKCIYDVI